MRMRRNKFLVLRCSIFQGVGYSEHTQMGGRGGQSGNSRISVQIQRNRKMLANFVLKKM